MGFLAFPTTGIVKSNIETGLKKLARFFAAVETQECMNGKKERNPMTLAHRGTP